MEVLGYKEIMELLHVSERTAYRILNKSDIPLILESPKKILKSDLLDYLKNQKSQH